MNFQTFKTINDSLSILGDETQPEQASNSKNYISKHVF